MELKVVQEFSNELLRRREVRFLLTHTGTSTPSRLEVKKAIASQFGEKSEDVYVIRYETKTGTHVSEGLCHVYEDPRFASLTLPKHVLLKNLPPEERKALKEKGKEKEKEKKGGGASEAKEGGPSKG